MFKKTLTIIPALTTVSLIAILFGVVTPARSEVVTEPNIYVSSRFLPGNPFPGSAWCNWSSYTDGDLYCEALNINDDTISFTFDPHRQLITYTTFSIPAITVGELILAWGLPTGYIPAGIGTKVTWQHRAIYVMSRVFAPSNKVSFVSYQLDEIKPTHPWRGFIIRRD
jgi:hypothetical protein